jgi:hypothetical protein
LLLTSILFCFILFFSLTGIAEEDDVIEGEQPKVITEEKDGDFDDEDYDDVELAELPPKSGSPSGRNDLKQFDDVDLAAPEDFNLVPSHRVLL